MKDLSKVFFNSIEEMNECYGIDAELHSNLHSNTDLVCYEIVEPFVYEYVAQYAFTTKGFHYLNNLGSPVIHKRNTFRSEFDVHEDDTFKHEDRYFVYVRVNEYLGKHLNKSLLGCEFVNMFEYPNQSKRKFIHYVWTKFHIEDQDGNISSIGSILLYPDDYSDPIPYQEWVKKTIEQDVEVGG